MEQTRAARNDLYNGLTTEEEMNVSNKITINQLREMPLGKIAMLSVEDLALLQEGLNGAKGHIEAIENKLRGGLDLKYGQRAAMQRSSLGKETGVVRFDDGVFNIVAEFPKRVKWDQSLLAVTVKTILEQWGEDPDQYVTTEYKVSEAAYTAWPDLLRKLFEPARNVEHSRPVYRLEKQNDGGQL